MVEKLSIADEAPIIEPGQYWRAISMRACGAAIVASAIDGVPAGFLALSVSHFAVNPPTVIMSINKATSALATIYQSRILTVNFLRSTDERLARNFGGKVKGSLRFEDDQWKSLRTGAPVLKNALGVLDCVLEETIERHETILAICQIMAFEENKAGDPLVFFGGRFHQFHP